MQDKYLFIFFFLNFRSILDYFFCIYMSNIDEYIKNTFESIKHIDMNIVRQEN
jgi:hypothetical protein